MKTPAHQHLVCMYMPVHERRQIDRSARTYSCAHTRQYLSFAPRAVCAVIADCTEWAAAEVAAEVAVADVDATDSGIADADHATHSRHASDLRATPPPAAAINHMVRHLFFSFTTLEFNKQVRGSEAHRESFEYCRESFE